MNWGMWILLAYSELGGEAGNQEVFKWLEKNADIPAQLLNEESYDRPKYRHTVRGYLSNLCEEGQLERLGRGRYRITERGVSDLADWSRSGLE